ncbi:type II toxin-antitoxin system RelE/ParE family toxin [Nostoc sp.]|uniref:type II toxin-antitoxin system RelE/ParE family toxin n=1 Tax=Nostoc sp. TaxID=1180 RepID=UPI003FA5295B
MVVWVCQYILCHQCRDNQQSNIQSLLRGHNLQPYVYATEYGKEPYTEWLENLKDYVVRSRIIRRIERLKQGNYGDCKSVGEGVQELRFFFGSGYRV